MRALMSKRPIMRMRMRMMVKERAKMPEHLMESILTNLNLDFNNPIPYY